MEAAPAAEEPAAVGARGEEGPVAAAPAAVAEPAAVVAAARRQPEPVSSGLVFAARR